MARKPFLKRGSTRKTGLTSSRTPSKYRIAKGIKIDYKEFNVIRKYVTERGKILSRRVTGASPKQQRALTREIKKARLLGLISTGAR